MPRRSFLSRIGRVFSGFWWLLDATRRTLLNLLLLALIVAIAWALLRGGPAPLQPKTALVLDLSGRLVEQRSGSLRDNAIKRARGDEDDQTRLRDVVAVLDAAAKDPAITQALLIVDGLGPAGLPKLREIGAAMRRFQAAGKPIVAWGTRLDQRQFFLAAQANEVWLDPMGRVDVVGYGRNRSYYKELLDKLGVQANVFRAGKYKNASEAFAASGPSPETLEADAALVQALWSTWTHGVETARKLPAGSIDQALAALPGSALALDGDNALLALQNKWVDALKTRAEMRSALMARGAAMDDDGQEQPQAAAAAGSGSGTGSGHGAQTFRQVHWADYLARIKPDTSNSNNSGDAVGIIVAEGSISDGNAGAGGIGGRSMAELIRQARGDDNIKAVVLRVDSPGGSAFGSELVRRELELMRQAGKPVVVSMGDVAASGGYWISLAADEMIADEATITGSIGVITVLPTATAAMAKLGVHSGGASTSWLPNAYDPLVGIDPRYAQLVQAGINHIYRSFTTRAAAARKTTPEQIDAVGQGRVWAGKQALQHNLVDKLGGLRDAVQAAAGRAKLAAWRVQYIEAQPGRLERLLLQMGVRTDALVPDVAAVLGDSLRALLGGATGLTPELQATLMALGGGLGGGPGGGLGGSLGSGPDSLAMPASAGLLQDLGLLARAAQDARQQQPTALVHCLCTVP